MGLTAEHNGVWLLECARAGVPPFLNMVGFVLAGGAIQRFGTPEQQAAPPAARRWRPSTCGASCSREPGAGSDLASLTTRAELDGERLRRQRAEGVVLGRPVQQLGHPDGPDTAIPTHARRSTRASRSSCSTMDLPGVEVRPLSQMTGEAEFDEVFFTDVALPAEHLLGPLHGGWGVGMAVLTNERGHIGTSVHRRSSAGSTRWPGSVDERDLARSSARRLADLLMPRDRRSRRMAQRQGPSRRPRPR